jgi:hypothetical protein
MLKRLNQRDLAAIALCLAVAAFFSGCDRVDDMWFEIEWIKR